MTALRSECWANMDLDRIRQLIELSKDSRAAEITLETPEGRLRVRRGPKGLGPPTPAAAGIAAQPVTAAAAAASALSEAQAEGMMVKSPYVGIFRRAPGAGKPPFVEVGERVEVGRSIAIVETLSVPNEITAPVGGIVSQVLVEDGKPVEYGQDLMLIVPAPLEEP